MLDLILWLMFGAVVLLFLLAPFVILFGPVVSRRSFRRLADQRSDLRLLKDVDLSGWIQETLLVKVRRGNTSEWVALTHADYLLSKSQSDAVFFAPQTGRWMVWYKPLALPEFELRPTFSPSWWVLDRDDINPPDNPYFATRYRLTGPDEAAVTRLFSARMLGFLESEFRAGRRYSIDSTGTGLVFWRTQIAPATTSKLSAYYDGSERIATMLSGFSDRSAASVNKSSRRRASNAKGKWTLLLIPVLLISVVMLASAVQYEDHAHICLGSGVHSGSGEVSLYVRQWPSWLPIGSDGWARISLPSGIGQQVDMRLEDGNRVVAEWGRITMTLSDRRQLRIEGDPDWNFRGLCEPYAP